MTDKLATELAARQPWLYAEGESWWVITGRVSASHTVTDCIAQGRLPLRRLVLHLRRRRPCGRSGVVRGDGVTRRMPLVNGNGPYSHEQGRGGHEYHRDAARPGELHRCDSGAAA